MGDGLLSSGLDLERVVGLGLRYLGDVGGDVRLGLGDVRLGLADVRLQIGRVLLDDDLAGPDDLALAEVDGDDAPRRAGRELHVLERLDVARDRDSGGDGAALHRHDLDGDAAAGVTDAGLVLGVLLLPAARAG